ncbi:MAG: CsbD family protein [Verrucomicrobia bacterium]|nr:CsbD family protein [Verrucomicrobiota bacterium]
MDTHTLKGNWHIAKGKLKQKYGSLTENDLEYVTGQEEELIGRIQKRTGANRDEIERFLDSDSGSGCD